MSPIIVASAGSAISRRHTEPYSSPDGTCFRPYQRIRRGRINNIKPGLISHCGFDCRMYPVGMRLPVCSWKIAHIRVTRSVRVSFSMVMVSFALQYRSWSQAFAQPLYLLIPVLNTRQKYSVCFTGVTQPDVRLILWIISAPSLQVCKSRLPAPSLKSGSDRTDFVQQPVISYITPFDSTGNSMLSPIPVL